MLKVVYKFQRGKHTEPLSDTWRWHGSTTASSPESLLTHPMILGLVNVDTGVNFWAHVVYSTSGPKKNALAGPFYEGKVVFSVSYLWQLKGSAADHGVAPPSFELCVVNRDDQDSKHPGHAKDNYRWDHFLKSISRTKRVRLPQFQASCSIVSSKTKATPGSQR